jgi:hypothetical protein
MVDCMTTRSFRISEYTSLDDVASWTREAGNSDVVFKVSTASGFAPMVEGVALGALQQLVESARVLVDCTVNPDKAPKLFESLFGVALALGAHRIQSPEGVDVKSETAARLWNMVLSSRGAFGIGNRKSLVFRDPGSPLPLVIRGANGEFPRRDQFRTALAKTLKSMGGDGAFSNMEENVVTFLYEATQNSHDHGRMGANSSVSGVRGILLDRLNVNSLAELYVRTDLSPFQRDYIQRAFSASADARRFFAFTVADLGVGIQHTLPKENEESDFDRLRRAFRPGVTRKPKSAGLESGLGLAKLHESARHLKALLVVKSAELLGYIDFSGEGSQDELTEEAMRFGAVGTSLTMVWPDTPFGGDQLSLL